MSAEIGTLLPVKLWFLVTQHTVNAASHKDLASRDPLGWFLEYQEPEHS